MNTTKPRTEQPTAREIIHTARRKGWTVIRLGGGMRTRFHRGDHVITVDWSRNGTVTYADRMVPDTRHGHSIIGVEGYWVADRVRDFRSPDKREAVTAWLLADRVG